MKTVFSSISQTEGEELVYGLFANRDKDIEIGFPNSQCLQLAIILFKVILYIYMKYL